MNLIKLINEIIIDEYYSSKIALNKGGYDNIEQYNQKLYNEYPENIRKYLKQHQSKKYLSVDDLNDLSHMYFFLYNKNFRNPETNNMLLNYDEINHTRKILIDKGLIKTIVR